MVTRQDDCTALDAGDIRFYDNYVPTLGVGDYLINVTQELNPVTTPKIDECYAASQAFSVQGPRYSLPNVDLFSVFPPNNASGVFEQFLPHVVLTQRELPWERNVFKDTDHAKQTPWMALLLFVEGELIGGKKALLTPTEPNASQQTMSAVIPASRFFPRPTGTILWPDLEREWYETDDVLQQTLCSVIDISPEAFATLVPTAADLRYLAHVRQVKTTAKDNDVLKVAGDGWYSVLVGNRLPDAPVAPKAAVNGTAATAGTPGKRNIVHLVSLEGLTPYLTGTPLPAGIQGVRLISLQSWSFTCLPESGGFSHLMNGLLTDPQGNPKQTSYTLAVPPPNQVDDDTRFAYQAIQNGYVPLRYEARFVPITDKPAVAEQTFAWYRGPFTPMPIKDFMTPPQPGSNQPPPWKPFGTASGAMIYDKTHGVFDASYGVAWETGRLRALADANFGQELLDWQRRGHSLVDMMLERKTQLATLKSIRPHIVTLAAGPLGEAAAPHLLSLARPHALTTDFVTAILGQFAEQITPKPSEHPAMLAAKRPIPYADRRSPVPTAQVITQLLSEPGVRTAVRIQGSEQIDPIVNWLARLYLLIGVPFETLVPTASLLPPESVRFFYVDPNWQTALLEGALSIGVESSRDQAYHDLMKDLIWEAMTAAAQRVRDALTGGGPNRPVLPPGQLSIAGMLLRSAAVSDWPGLQVYGYQRTQSATAEPDGDSELPLLRMERLSSDILLCLWPAVPAVVTIDEPHEGVAFGFEDPPKEKGDGYYLYLRSLAEKDYGMPLDPTTAIDAQSTIIDAHRRIGITGAGGLIGGIQAKLTGQPTINVRDFAVQMIKTPERAVFAARPVTAAAEERS